MGPSCGYAPAAAFSSRFFALVSSLLIALLVVPQQALAAPKPLNPITVHDRVVKRGLNQWVAVEENNGVVLAGRILAINPDTFTLQLPNDPEPVTIAYADVIRIESGPSRGFWLWTGVGLGAAAGFAIWGVVHMHNFEQEHQLPNPQPVVP